MGFLRLSSTLMMVILSADLITESVQTFVARQRRQGPQNKVASSLLPLILPDGDGSFMTRSYNTGISDQGILVEIVCSTKADAVLQVTLTSAGAQITSCYDYICSARISPAQLESVAALDQVVFIHRSMPVKHGGSVTSEGVAVMKVDQATTQFDVNGTGIKIGVLSNSFDCLGGVAADVASGDLPAMVTVLKDITENCTVLDADDEGRGMLQLVYDVAPGAEEYFRSGWNGSADFAQGIQELVDAGCNVIVDDLSYLTEPFFQDGILAKAAEAAVDQGVTYFTAIGNIPRGQTWDALHGFNDSGTVYDDGDGTMYKLHQFGVDTFGFPATFMPLYFLNIDNPMTIVMQWDEPFASVSGPPGSSSDLAILFYTDPLSEPFTGSDDPNMGADPLEGFSFNPIEVGVDSSQTVVVVYMAIALSDGPPPSYIKVLSTGDVLFGLPNGVSVNRAHANTKNVAAVAAASYRQTPAFGVSPPVAEDFTSPGGTPIFFDANGTRLSEPEIRAQPRFTGPDDTSTTFFGVLDNTTNTYRFSGTSAAAPHVAALATLLLQKNPDLTPAQVYALLQNTAVDMDDPITPSFDVGFDFLTGYGLVDAESALLALESGSSPTHAPLAGPLTTAPNVETTSSPASAPTTLLPTAAPAMTTPVSAPVSAPVTVPSPVSAPVPVSQPTSHHKGDKDKKSMGSSKSTKGGEKKEAKMAKLKKGMK